MSASDSTPAGARGWSKTARVIIVGSVMFSFISYWRTAAVVLCDMSSTVYYIGAIVESAIGKAAPWFILAVLLFSYAMRAVYIESCSLFVRGGVYRIVKEAMGGFLAKISVSALMFDYILTGPISGVSAGQYIVGLLLEASTYADIRIDEGTRDAIKAWGSVAIACAITLYFYRQNLLGITESSDKALKIMIVTTIMGVVLLTWCGVTLAVKGPVNTDIPLVPDLTKKVEIDDLGKIKIDPATGEAVKKLNPITGEQEDPLGFLGYFPSISDPLRNPTNWLSIIGAVGIIIAFGHSILAMSGEELLAQVYREVESPKLPNFKKAAFIVFIYSLILTGTMNFLAVMLIPDGPRMGEYADNWMGGLAMQMAGPLGARLLLNAFVVFVGFLILFGAVNTSIIGSNGVLSRVAEDGVLPDAFLKPHPRFGTNYRILWLITGLQLFTIIASHGDVILLGEAYAFGVVWSFVFMTSSMVVLRFKDPRPREFKVPFNIRLGGREIPIGLGFVCLVVIISAIANLLTKQVATISGLIFAGAFLVVFTITERYYERKRRGAKHEHLEQFNREMTPEVSVANLELTKPYRKLVAIRSPQNLFMLEKALVETDPDTTDVVVMTAKVLPQGHDAPIADLDLDRYDQQLMTAVVERAEKAGKNVKPLIVSTNNPLHALLKTAQDIGAQEVVVGASNKFTAEEQLDQMAFYWINMHEGRPRPLSIRILSRDRDIYYDVEGGSRIPKISERQARTVAELREAGVGVDRVMLIHDGTPAGSDLFQAVLTMLDPQIGLTVAALGPIEGECLVNHDFQGAERLGRHVQLVPLDGDIAATIVREARERGSDLILVPMPASRPGVPEWAEQVRQNAHCRVAFVSEPALPAEPVAI